MKKLSLGKKPLLIFTILLVLVGIVVSFKYYFDFIAFKEIGANYTEVFFTNMQAKIIAQSASFILVFALLLISFTLLKKNLTKIDESFSFLRKKYLIFIASFGLAFVVSSIIQSTVYDSLLQFLNPVFFQQGDPIFFKDIGYYLFQRPFLVSLIDSLYGIFIFVTIAVFVIYIFLYLRLGITNISQILKVKSIAVHNLVNLAIVILLKAFSYLFKIEGILYSTNGVALGAGYTDVHIWQKYFKLAPILLIAIVVIAIIFLYKNKPKYSLITVLVYPLTFVAFIASSLFTQGFVVKPQELSMEEPYITNNIDYTRMAYGLNKIESQEFNINYNLSKDTLAKENATLSNTRIIDYQSTVKALNQVQSIRNFYKFNDLDIVKYDIKGEPTAVALAPRELNKEALSSTTKSFSNERLRFTHGYGVAATQVNQVTSEGQPSFLIKDIPPVSVDGMPQITQPRVYFGESTNDFVIVNSGYKELDYAEGQNDVEFSYDGNAGIKMTPFNKLLFSIYQGDFQILISNLVTPESKILINRNVIDRVRTVAPFLQTDNDPYMVIDDSGKLKWVVNCYTTSSNFPYATYTQFNGNNINYIRDSVKAVVDAYDGNVNFYITDEADPVVQSYKKIYPSFFTEGGLPSDIASHLQYPETMFNIQSQIFKKYHTTNPGTFYNKTDIWEIAKEKYMNEVQFVAPYYSLTSLFSETPELTLMIPYTMANKDNLVAWLGVSCAKESYGKMVLYKFPKGENVYGTMQIENKIDNDPNVSREMTLWGQGGSTVIRGNILVIPTGNSLIYVEPVYLSSGAESSLPELKRVIVAYNDKIAMEPTFEQAILKLFDYKLQSDIPIVSGNENSPTKPTEQPPQTNISPEDKIVIEHFDAIKKSMNDGDWVAFGENFKKLEDEINKLR